MTTVRELLDLQREHHGAQRVRDVLGDGYLYLHNPFYRRVRRAAWHQGYRFDEDPSGIYFGFPLAGLEHVLTTQRIPYRASARALQQLEQARPGFYELSDLRGNRPAPSYLLHEGAHAVAYEVLFDGRRDVGVALREPNRLVDLLLGEGFANSAEYLGASVARLAEDPVHRWLYSISSYCRSVPAAKALERLAAEHALEAVVWLVLASYLLNNCLAEKVSRRELDAWMGLGVGLGIDGAQALGRERGLARTASELMQLSADFRAQTMRLFLTSLGYSRSLAAVEGLEPLPAIANHAKRAAAVVSLVRVLTAD